MLTKNGGGDRKRRLSRVHCICTMHCVQCTLEKQCTANHVINTVNGHYTDTLTHWTLGDLNSILNKYFSINSSHWCLRYFLWDRSQINVTRPDLWKVNIDFTYPRFDPDLCCHMASPGHIEWPHWRQREKVAICRWQIHMHIRQTKTIRFRLKLHISLYIYSYIYI